MLPVNQTSRSQRAGWFSHVQKPEDDALLFLITKYRNSWAKNTTGNPVSLVFRRRLDDCKLHRSGIGFYSLRRTFETVAGETPDEPAVDLVMGHVPDSDDMAARYRQRVGDDRLEVVAEHVRGWLFEKGKKVPVKNGRGAVMA